MKLATLAARTGRLALAMARGKRLPFSITFILTHRCNFRCDYCNVPEAAGDEMTSAEFRAAIDELAEAGLARAGFSGGEALLRNDAIEIIAHAKSRGLTTTLNSNAWLAEGKLEELAPALDLLVLSIDGPEATHDLVRRRRGSYARVVATLARARELGVKTATITVLTEKNLDVVDDVLAIAREHGSWAYFQPAYEDCFDQRAGLDPALLPRIYADVAARLDRARVAGERVGSSSAFLERLARGPSFGECDRCHAGRYFGTVMPDGTVVPCHLKSSEGRRFDGRKVGFARAFADADLPSPGPGCAISPYQEADLVFGLDPAAIVAAARRFLT